MVMTLQAQVAMEQLKRIYGKARMANIATKFPLGQRLLLAPLATNLNDTNLDVLQCLQRLASFCKEIATTQNDNITGLDKAFPLMIEGATTKWTLQQVLIQVAHLEQE